MYILWVELHVGHVKGALCVAMVLQLQKQCLTVELLLTCLLNTAHV
jgi:hypothetical protein